MKKILNEEQKNGVLDHMWQALDRNRTLIIQANQRDLDLYEGTDKAMYDRLKVDVSKVDAMINSLKEVRGKPDPVGQVLYSFAHKNHMRVENKTAPFGKVLIIYESRPDVTVEAAAIAFKSGNQIFLKGGKESRNSNLLLVQLWHEALKSVNLESNWVQYLDLNRSQTQNFLQNPLHALDLIVPRGGEGLIAFVKQHATCPVLVSGRGNNFLYVHTEADLIKAWKIVWNGKMDKISACNALDKVLVDRNLPGWWKLAETWIRQFQEAGVSVLVDETLKSLAPVIAHESVWQEEFLDYKIAFGTVEGPQEAIDRINHYSGGHSAAILTENATIAQIFLENVDAAAVYHNASTRFTDGGQFGLGAELAISTDKMHHRGPLGLQHLITNKWYIYGNGQTR